MATFIAHATGTNDSAGTALAASTTLSVQAGDALFVFGKYEDFTGTNSATDNDAGGSNTYTAVTAQTGSTPYGVTFLAIAKATNAALTVTLNTGSTSDFRRMIVVQARPASGKTFSLDKSNSARSSSSGTTFSSGSITPTASGFAAAFFGCDSSLVFTQGSGWTADANIAGDTQSEYQLIASGGTAITGTGSTTVAVNWTAHVLNVQESGGAVVTGAAIGRPSPGNRQPSRRARFNKSQRDTTTSVVTTVGALSAAAASGTSAVFDPSSSAGALSAAGASGTAAVYDPTGSSGALGAAGTSGTSASQAPNGVDAFAATAGSGTAATAALSATLAAAAAAASGTAATAAVAGSGALVAPAATGTAATMAPAATGSMSATAASGTAATGAVQGAEAVAAVGASGTAVTAALTASYALAGVASSGTSATFAPAGSGALAASAGSGTAALADTSSSAGALAAVGNSGTAAVAALAALSSGSITAQGASGTAATLQATGGGALAAAVASGTAATVAVTGFGTAYVSAVAGSGTAALFNPFGTAPTPPAPTFAQYYFPPPGVGGGPLPERKRLSTQKENLITAAAITRGLWEKGQIDQEQHDKILTDIRKRLRGRLS